MRLVPVVIVGECQDAKRSPFVAENGIMTWMQIVPPEGPKKCEVSRLEQYVCRMWSW